MCTKGLFLSFKNIKIYLGKIMTLFHMNRVQWRFVVRNKISGLVFNRWKRKKNDGAKSKRWIPNNSYDY